jgi:hypothetical protein
VVRYHASPADAFLADIATSAIGLAGGPERDRLRRCQAPGCGRWFLASRPRQTWCSPSCDNRARLARFQQRRRAAQPPTGVVGAGNAARAAAQPALRPPPLGSARLEAATCEPVHGGSRAAPSRPSRWAKSCSISRVERVNFLDRHAHL